MNNRQCLSFSRLLLFIKSDLSLNRSAILTTVSTITAVLLLLNLLNPDNILSINESPSAFTVLLFAGGCWLSSMAFRNFRDPTKNCFFLMIPTTNFEKFLARYLLTSIGYALALLLFYCTFYWLIAIAAMIISGKNYFTTLPLSIHTWQLILNCLFLQSIFFLGSIYFRRYALIKTILAITSISIILAIFSFATERFRAQYYLLHNIVVHYSTTDLTNISILFKLAFTFLFLVVAYFRLREIEA